MKLRYLALAAAMAFSAPAFAAPVAPEDASRPVPLPTEYVSTAYVAPTAWSFLKDSSTFEIASGTYSFWLAATSPSATTGVFSASLIDYATNKVLQTLSFQTNSTNQTLVDFIENISLAAGKYTIEVYGTSFGNAQVAGATGLYNDTVAVPGPEAGAGLGALAMGGIALVLKRRRKQDFQNA